MSEYAIVAPGSIARAPAKLDAISAAAVPVVAIAALQTLRDIAKVKKGDRVLVNGATLRTAHCGDVRAHLLRQLERKKSQRRR